MVAPHGSPGRGTVASRVAVRRFSPCDPAPKTAYRPLVGPSRSTLPAPVSRRRTAFLACVLHLVGAVFLTTAAHAVTWAEIRQRGVLRWGNDAEGGAPYIYHDPQRPETLTGFEVDLAGALTAKLGVGSAFVQQNWDMLIPALGDGTSFDIIIAGLERSPENLAKIAMSRPYLAFGQQLVVRADQPLVTSLDPLKGRPVGVLSGTVSYRILEARGDLDVRVYQDNVNYFRDLETGRLDAVLTDTPIAQVNLAGNAKLRRAGPPFAPGSYAIGVRREEPEHRTDEAREQGERQQLEVARPIQPRASVPSGRLLPRQCRQHPRGERGRSAACRELPERLVRPDGERIFRVRFHGGGELGRPSAPAHTPKRAGHAARRVPHGRLVPSACSVGVGFHRSSWALSCLLKHPRNRGRVAVFFGAPRGRGRCRS